MHTFVRLWWSLVYRPGCVASARSTTDAALLTLPPQVVVVTGRPGCVASARELIETAVNERISSTKNQQTVTLTLPQSAVGKIIGRQGTNIRAIQRESGAKMSTQFQN